jgi:hypothetical protein
VPRLAEGLVAGALPAVTYFDIYETARGRRGRLGDRRRPGPRRPAAAQGPLPGQHRHRRRGAGGPRTGLRRRPALEALFLWNSPFGDDGLAALVAPPPPAGTPPPPAGALKKLKRLDLTGTRITDAGCAALAAALDSGALPALTKLELEDIPASDAAQEAVRAALDRSRGRGASSVFFLRSSIGASCTVQ